MKTFAAFAKWLWRAWPLLLTLVLGMIHWLVFIGAGKTPCVNKAFAAVLQIIGGLIVLHSINENLGLFGNHGLIAAIKNYFRACPLHRSKQIIGHASGVSASGAIGVASVTVNATATTLEDRISALENRIAELRTEFLEKEMRLDARINQVQTEARQSSESHRQGIKELSGKLERTFVGGIKMQTFGVMLAVYGAILGAFT